MFTVTKQWLDSHSTDRGGHTSSQLQSLGFGWPPPPRWKRQVIGEQITEPARLAFESGKVKKKNKLAACIKLAKQLSPADLEKLREFINTNTTEGK